MTNSKQNAKDEALALAESYDQFPYISYPFEYNRPENLRTIGMLFGMTPPKLDTARVLELGCSSGGNIIRFAENYPKSHVLGVDLSGVEIRHGQENIKKLGLTNIELKHMSITDLDESYGKFDYIICHGIYSWVPDFVREKILEVSNKLLNKNGIAFVSYNTLPGWNMVNTVRELMMYHASNFQTEHERLSQARHVLNFLKESLEGSDTPHAKFASTAVNMISDKKDYYVRHEYLSEENKAFYFHEFMEDAKKHDLEYVGDSDLHRMFIGNLPANAAEKLCAINDIIKTEQYIDFICNTQFRCTLLCHKGTELSRNITLDRLRHLYLTCNLTPEVPESKDVFENISVAKFFVNNNKDLVLSSSSAVLKAVMYVLHENLSNPLSIEEIIDLVHKKIPEASKATIEAELAQNMPRLIFSSYFKLFASKPIFKYKISDKPKISSYGLFQVGISPQDDAYYFTNQVNSPVAFQEYQSHILKLLDGKHSVDQIKEDIFQKLKNGIINATIDSKKVEDEAQLREVGNNLVQNTLEYLRINYSLVG